MPTIEVNGVQIWYEFSGEGPPLVQIGGAVSGHEGYATVTPGLSASLRILDYDHRGYGLSDRPAQKYGFDVWAHDLAGLLDALGIGRTHVHGGSMGSFIAVWFAAHYPDRVERMVLGAGAAAKCDYMAHLHFTLWQRIATTWGMDSDEMAMQLASHAYSRAFLDGPDGGAATVAAIREVAARCASVPVFIDACEAMMTTDVTDLLGLITAPTLVLCGSEDVLTPLDQGPAGVGARAVAERIPNARLHVFPGSAHAHYAECAEESVEVIREFLLE